jgi:hypothetical protein
MRLAVDGVSTQESGAGPSARMVGRDFEDARLLPLELLGVEIRGAAELAPILHTHPNHPSEQLDAPHTSSRLSQRDYARRGVVPSVKIGRQVVFIEDDLVDHVKSLRSTGEHVAASW